MPEFRFRRKKQQARRRTLHDAEEAAQQIQAAKEQLGSPADGKGIDGEREKFFELLKSKYPEQTSGIELEQVLTNGKPPSMANGHTHTDPKEPISRQNDDDVIKTSGTSELPPVRAALVRRISSRYSECIFLRHGSDLRRCPMPSPITLSTIRNLFLNMFDLSPALLEDPQCSIFIREKDSEVWRALENTSMIYDRCTLLLMEGPEDHAPSTTPSQPQEEGDLSHQPGEEESQGSERSPESGGSRESQGSEDTSTERKKLAMQRNNGLWRGAPLEDLTAIPSPQTTEGAAMVGSPLSLTSATSPVVPKVDAWLSGRVRSVHRAAKSLQEEVGALRVDHTSQMEEFRRTLVVTGERISAAICAFRKTGGLSAEGADVFRRERLELYPLQEAYTRRSEHTLHDVSILETAVEEMRVDVVRRRCRVMGGEVEALDSAVQSANRDVQELRDQYLPLETKMKRVMEQELQTIVKEERFQAEEGSRLEGAVERCGKLTETLSTLRQFEAVQLHRSPHIPVFTAVPNPDRKALMENIEAITSNHLHRIEALELAKSVHQKKKEFTSPKKKIKQFESQLRIQRDHLRRTGYPESIESRKEMRLKAWFLSEKFDREKQLQQELEIQQRLVEKKREQERREAEKRWQCEQRQKQEERRGREKHSQEIVMQSMLLQNGGRKMNYPPTLQGRTHSDEIPASSTTTSAFTRNIPAVGRVSLAPSQHRKIARLAPRERKSIGYLGEFEDMDVLSDPLPVASAPQHPSERFQGPRNVHLTVGERKVNNKSNGKQLSPRFQHHVAMNHNRGSNHDQARKRKVSGNRYSLHEAVFESSSQPDIIGPSGPECVVVPNCLSQPDTEIRRRANSLDKNEGRRVTQQPTTATKLPGKSNSEDSVHNFKPSPGQFRKPAFLHQPPTSSRPPAVGKSSNLPRQQGVVPPTQPHSHSHRNLESSVPTATVSPQHPRKSVFHHSYTQHHPHSKGLQSKGHLQRLKPTQMQAGFGGGENMRLQGFGNRSEVSAAVTHSSVSDNRHNRPVASAGVSGGHTSSVSDNRHNRPVASAGVSGGHTSNARYPPEHHSSQNPQSLHVKQSRSGVHTVHPQTMDFPLTAYPRGRTATGHPVSSNSAATQRKSQHSGVPVASGRVTHYPSNASRYPVRSFGMGSLV